MWLEKKNDTIERHGQKMVLLAQLATPFNNTWHTKSESSKREDKQPAHFSQEWQILDNAPAQCVLERYTKHDYKSAIVPIKVYTFRYFTPALEKCIICHNHQYTCF